MTQHQMKIFEKARDQLLDQRTSLAPTMDFVTLNLSYDLLTGYCIVIADRGAAPRKQNVNQNRICACRCNRS